MIEDTDVWACRYITDSTSIYLRLTYHIDELHRKEFQLSHDTRERVADGVHPQYLFLPYYDLSEEQKQVKRDICSIRYGVIVITERLKVLFERFELGNTQILKMPVYEYDQKTPRSAALYILHIAEKRQDLFPSYRKASNQWRVVPIGRR